MNVFEMECFRSIVGVFQKYCWSVTNRVRNEEVRRGAGTERELASRTDLRVMR